MNLRRFFAAIEPVIFVLIWLSIGIWCLWPSAKTNTFTPQTTHIATQIQP